ncbi:MAG TPA: type II toxin-antitoxin system antitoxin SocA domain-containing protein [bacterium]|nr:type II toxin-antitoxin system antitoxin SocA domain-containing protein [bacterium]
MIKKILGEKIRKLREEYELSQEVLAAKLGLPRPAISQIESGQREVSSIELSKIARLFEVSADELLKQGLQKAKYGIPQKKTGTFKFDKEKFKQIVLYVLDKCGAKANVGKTVLFKLLYFIDFNFYELYEEPLTGESYRRIIHGPAPCHFDGVIGEMETERQVKPVATEYHGKPQKKYLPLVDVDVSRWNWSAREQKVIDDVIGKLSAMDAVTIEAYSHEDIPWKISRDKELIKYESVFYRTQPYSVRIYGEE